MEPRVELKPVAQEISQTNTQIPNLSGPAIAATRAILPELNPSPQTRAAAVIASRSIASNMNVTTPVDPLKFVNASNLGRLQAGMTAINPTMAFISTVKKAESAGAGPLEAATVSTAAVCAQQKAGLALNQKLFSNLPQAATLAGRFGQKFGGALLSFNAVKPLLEVVPNYYQLQKKNSPLVSGIASTVGGITSYAAGATGLTLVVSSAPSFASGVGVPLAITQVAAGTALIIISDEMGQQAAKETAALLNAIPAYYEHAVEIIQKFPEIAQAANTLVNEKFQSIKQTTNNIINLFNQVNSDIYSQISALKHQQNWSEEETHIFSVSVSQCLGEYFPVTAHGMQFNQLARHLESGNGNQKQNIKPMLQHATMDTEQHYQKVVLPLLGQMVEAWTDTSIENFKSNKEVVKLANDLQVLKEASAPPRDIIAKTIELKNCKAKIICEREKFDAVMKDCGSVVSAAGNLAIITGNNKAARDINVIGGSALSLAQVVASLCGYSAAAITPIGAVSAVLGVISTVMSMKSQKENSQQILLSYMQTIQREMHERFDEVMQGLDKLSKQQIQHFLSLKLDNQIVEQKVDRIERIIERNHQGYNNSLNEIDAKLKNMEKDKIYSDKKNTLLGVIGTVNEKVISVKGATVGGQGGYDEVRAKILNFAGGTSGLGATHVDLVGEFIHLDDIDQLDKSLIDCHPYFHLQTLSSYYNQLNLAHYPTLSTVQVHDQLKLALAEKNQFQLENVLTIRNVIDVLPKKSEFKIESLRQIFETQSEEIIKIIPLHVNAKWSLLLFDTFSGQVVYFSLPNNERLSEKIIQIAKQLYGDRAEIVCQLIHGSINPENSHLWLIKAVESIVNCHTIEDCINSISQVMIGEEARVESKPHGSCEQQVVNNPLIHCYLSLKLLEVTYFQHQNLGKEPVNISTQEIFDIQKMLEASESFYQVFTQFSNVWLFEKLFADYMVSCVELTEFVNNEVKKFNQETTRDLNEKAKELAKKHYYDHDVLNKFLQESISFEIYGNWFQDGTCVQNNSKRGVVDTQNRDYASCRFDIDTAYIQNQASQVKEFKNKYVENRSNEFNKLELSNNYLVYSDWMSQKNFYPIIITPVNESLPYLHATNTLFSVIPQEIKKVIDEAQMLSLGHFICTYDIVESNYVFNIQFIIEQQVYCVSKLSVKYDHLFYNGKEAIVWSWCGGNYALSALASGNGAYQRSTQINHAGNFWVHTFSGPVLTQNKGLMEIVTENPSKLKELLDRKIDKPAELSKQNESLNRKDENIRGQLSINTSVDCKDNKTGSSDRKDEVDSKQNNDIESIRKIVAARKLQLQRKFCEDLANKLNTSSHKVLKKLNVHYKLLKMFSEIVFPHCFNDEKSALYSLFVNNDFVVNEKTLQAHLQQKPEKFILDSALPISYLDNYLSEVRSRLSQTRGLSRLNSVDELQQHLLVCLNEMVPNVVQLRTDSARAQFYGKITDEFQKGIALLAKNMRNNPKELSWDMVADLLENVEKCTLKIREQFEGEPGVSINALLTQASISRPLLMDSKDNNNGQRFFQPADNKTNSRAENKALPSNPKTQSITLSRT